MLHHCQGNSLQEPQLLSHIFAVTQDGADMAGLSYKVSEIMSSRVAVMTGRMRNETLKLENRLKWGKTHRNEVLKYKLIVDTF